MAELAPAALAAMDPAAAGLAVMQEADRRDMGYQDLTVVLTMILRTADGRETSRELRIAQLEVPDDGDKLLVVFDAPKPIRGTALLSHSHPRSDNDQWLYLPAVKRVKKIAARNKSGPFLSSEFAFEDLSPQVLEKYSYRYQGTTACDQGDCYQVERIPTDEYSGYSRQLVWLDVDQFRVLKVEYFDRRGELLKTLVASGFQIHQERFWRAARMLMVNHQNRRSTELQWRDFQFANGLSADRDFSANSLLRAR